MSKKRPRKEPPADAAARACLVHGWVLVTVFLTLGLVLETLHLVKLPFYVDVLLRRELWTLAHAHGTLLGVLVLLFGLAAPRLLGPASRRRTASGLVRTGSVLVPCGFFFGGLGAAEGDPSLAIVLVPLGAVLFLLGLGLLIHGPRP